ncbi:MAG TPA: NACHT domain-containing protein, partial [Pyrinomonadaceae bacterium]
MSDSDTDLLHVPSWLETPPLASVPPPVETRKQELPFEHLTWENFEKLCVRLARLEADVEHCQLYGVRGQDQEGIDLYAKSKTSGQYTVYQCKREKGFSASKIEGAVTTFLAGTWSGRASTFVLCTMESLVSTGRAEEVERQRTILAAKGVDFVIWDGQQLSLRLKALPVIVDDFFGRTWVEAFCGGNAADQLGGRLDAVRMAEFRLRLGNFYQRLFNNHDPGLPLLASTVSDDPIPLSERYVLPDITDSRSIETEQPIDGAGYHLGLSGLKELRSGDTPRGELLSEKSYPSYKYQNVSQRQRVETWLGANRRCVILGGPGSGKSSLLRFLCLDLFQDEPQLTELARWWGQFLPVWIPFAFWTRKFSTSEGRDVPLTAMLEDWFKGWDEGHLWPIVRQALDDERLLLLVDGLDEYSDEDAARNALLRLKIFIEQRNATAVLTARPRGFARLGMQTAGWGRGDLSDLSEEQQEQLTRIWFTHRERKVRGSAGDDEDVIACRVEAEVQRFLGDLRRSSELRELARVPLLLCLLIAYKILHVQLPQNRFKAYQALVDYLIHTHPERRRLAALIRETPLALTDEEVKRAFANLAYRIQSQYGTGVVEQTEAIKATTQFLSDESGVIGFEAAEARKVSRELIHTGEDTLGLLVERSQSEIGFFHRALQEYLAAYHLSTISHNERVSIVEEHCVEPQWREVILNLFSILNSIDEVSSYVRSAFKRQVAPHERYEIEQLLAEVVFGGFNVPVGLSREIARTVFRVVETESWMPHRERLLDQAVAGLRSAKTREMVKDKLKVWFPDRTRKIRAEMFSAVAGWPSSADSNQCLLLGLRDEDSTIKRAAAKALAALNQGDEEIGEQVAELAWSEADPRTRAAAIECLMLGWPNHSRLTSIIDAARASVFPRLRLMGINGKVRQGRATDEDLNQLFYLGSRDAGVDRRWFDFLVESLVKGWTGSPEVKQRCLDAVERTKTAFGAMSDFGLYGDLGKAVLLSGYPQDNEVAQVLAREVNWGSVSLRDANMRSVDFFDLLAKNFKDHPKVVEAVDRWLRAQKGERKGSGFYRAALVGRTTLAKSLLIDSLHSKHAGLAAQTLLEGWGLQDQDVAQALLSAANGPHEWASQLGEYLPLIITDVDICRRRLLELISHAPPSAVDSVLKGLASLGETFDDAEVVDAVLQIPVDNYGHQPGHKALIKYYPWDSRVRELAKDVLNNPDDRLSAVATAYGADDYFRSRIIELMTPLPAHLRKVMAQRLGEEVGDDFSLTLLESYNDEADADVRVQASISYHSLLKTLGRDTDAAIKVLSNRIVDYSKDWAATRHAAFSGLLVLGRLDVMMNAQEKAPKLEDIRCRFPLSRGEISPSVPLIRLLLKNWVYIRATFGEEFWFRLGYEEERLRSDLWYYIIPFANEYPQPRAEVINYLEASTEKSRFYSPRRLHFLSRALPKSTLLRQYCMSILAGDENKFDFDGEESVIAAEIIASQFRDDEVVQRWLNENIREDYGEEGVPDNIILLL